MYTTDLAEWQQALLKRLERGLGRELAGEEFNCVEWNQSARTLTVLSPLRTELRAKNLISHVFRSALHRGQLPKDAV